MKKPLTPPREAQGSADFEMAEMVDVGWRARAGYSWRVGAARDDAGQECAGVWLTGDESQGTAYYSPLRRPTLADEFERTASECEQAIRKGRRPLNEIAAFAGRFGLLGRDRWWLQLEAEDWSLAEPLEIWLEELECFLNLRRYWRALKVLGDMKYGVYTSGRDARLDGAFARVWEKHLTNVDQTRFFFAPVVERWPLEKIGLEGWPPLRHRGGRMYASEGSKRQLAWECLLDQVNERLRGHVNMTFALGGKSPRYIPDSLLGAIYIRFGLQITRSKLAGQLCQHCEQPMSARSNKKYCSDACRNAAYNAAKYRQNAQERARQQHKSGEANGQA